MPQSPPPAPHFYRLLLPFPSCPHTRTLRPTRSTNAAKKPKPACSNGPPPHILNTSNHLHRTRTDNQQPAQRTKSRQASKATLIPRPKQQQQAQAVAAAPTAAAVMTMSSSCRAASSTAGPCRGLPILCIGVALSAPPPPLLTAGVHTGSRASPPRRVDARVPVAASRPLRVASLHRCRRSSRCRTGRCMLLPPVPVRPTIVGWGRGELTPCCGVSTALFAAAPLLLLSNAMVLPQDEYGCGRLESERWARREGEMEAVKEPRLRERSRRAEYIYQQALI